MRFCYTLFQSTISMFEGVHIVLRMMLSPARGFVPPSLRGNYCKVECLIKGNRLIAGNPLSRKIPNIINMFTELVPGTRLNIQCKSVQTKNKKNIGKAKETKATKRGQGKN